MSSRGQSKLTWYGIIRLHQHGQCLHRRYGNYRNTEQDHPQETCNFITRLPPQTTLQHVTHVVHAFIKPSQAMFCLQSFCFACFLLQMCNYMWGSTCGPLLTLTATSQVGDPPIKCIVYERWIIHVMLRQFDLREYFAANKSCRSRKTQRFCAVYVKIWCLS